MAGGDTLSMKPDYQSMCVLERLRAENESLKAAAGKKKRHFWRSFLVWMLIILACFFAITGTLSAWVKTTTLDTNTFVNTVAPLIKNDAVAKAVSDEAVTQLFKTYNVEGQIKTAVTGLQQLIQQAAPAGAKLPDVDLSFIAGPVASGLESFAKTTTQKILQSKAFYTIWSDTIRAGHTAMVNILTGKQGAVVTSKGDTVILNLGALLTQVKDKLAGSGLTFLNKVQVPANFGQIELFTAKQLGAAKGGVHLLQVLSWVLPLLALIFFALAVWAAVDHRKGLLRVGIGLAVAMLLVLIVLKVAHSALFGQIKVAENLAAANVIWNSLLVGLRQVVRGLLALGIIVAVASGIAGPSKLATWLRTHFTDFFKNRRARREAGVEEQSPFYTFMNKYTWWLRGLGFAVAIIVLVAIPHISALAIILTVVILGIYLIVVEFLR
jgi:hypothetical protein